MGVMWWTIEVEVDISSDQEAVQLAVETAVDELMGKLVDHGNVVDPSISVTAPATMEEVPL